MEHKLRRLAGYYKPYKALFFSDMFFAMLGAVITLAIRCWCGISPEPW